MRPYSPTQTSSFMECPVNRDLHKAGWVSSVYTYRESAMFAGSAMNDGMVIWYRGRNLLPKVQLIDSCVHAMQEKLRIELKHTAELGITWKDDVSAQLVTLPDRMEKCIRKLLVNDPIPSTWQIMEHEPRWKEYGNCRPDIIVKTDTGKIFPIDFKFKIQLDKEKRSHALSEYAYSWQMMHYAWATAQRYECEVKTHGVFLITAAPFHGEPQYFPIDPQLMHLWFESAQSVWAVMACVDGEPKHLLERMGIDAPAVGPGEKALTPWHTFKFHTRYGLDPYGEAVLYHKLDPYLMAQSYVNKKAKGDEPGAPPEGK